MKINAQSSQINFKRVMKIDETGNTRRKGEFTDCAENSLLKALNEERNCYTAPEKKKITSFFREFRDRKNKKAIITEYKGQRYLLTDKEAEDVYNLKEYAKNVNNFPTLKIPFYVDDIRYKQSLTPFIKETNHYVEKRYENLMSEAIRQNPITTIHFDEKTDRKIKKITITEETYTSTTSKTLDLNI